MENTNNNANLEKVMMTIKSLHDLEDSTVDKDTKQMLKIALMKSLQAAIGIDLEKELVEIQR